MKIIMQLDELTCPSCMQKIDTALKKQKGVEDVRVLFNASKVKATIDPDQVTASELSAVIEKLGFAVQSVKMKQGV
ncbi:heavy-metal-associated domain-containing protein [Sporolactobacillus vineae]|uniref:heavy-metal-associated domain-containing protein n=1 Tax=Sporolactobacillus vineae TaxID=444463 RepID=UPI000288C051|nr:heavy-metal-associated domain-containing protein [Sporolactobacillus vineae]